MPRVLILMVFSLLLAACQTPRQTSAPAVEDDRPAHTDGKAAKRVSGLELSGFNHDARPQDDLYEFTNGTWLEETEIPPGRADYGSFTKLSEEAEDHILAILADLRDSAPEPGSTARLISDFQQSLIDRETANARGLEPLEDELAEIAALTYHDQIWQYLPRGALNGGGSPIGAFVNQDARNATEYILYLNQAGLTLPDRDYYLEDGERYAKARARLADYATTLFELAGLREPEQRAEQVLAIESRLAEAQWSRVRNRNPLETYNRMTLDELTERTGGAPWASMFRTLDIERPEALVVRQPSYVKALPEIMTEFPVPAWQDWLRFKLIDNHADWLSDPFFEASFSFNQTALRGVEEPRELDKRALEVLNRNVGMALGKLYVERHFEPESKARMEELVTNLRTAFRQSLMQVEWMTDTTRVEALDKLDKFNTKIAYPDKWRDYTGLEIRPDDVIGNIQRAGRFEYRRNLDRLGQPVDRDEWFMTPQTVNAYYNPLMNEIVFPAAILQPPFFNPNADDAVNYGGIGAVIGHELGHGFDDSGRQYDGNGNLRDWWTEEDAAEYQQRANRIVGQYGEYNPIDNMYIDGKLTLGENIGDIGGLTLAWRAYQLSLDGHRPPVMDGFTGAQRFFLGWSQVWRRKYQDEELRRRLNTDPHSPSRYRVNGVVVNLPTFYEAFGVSADDALWLPPEERVQIW